ncbi:MAG: hypothetical protein U5K37_10820 [Natrialbaceae archaeon]|nr:hypothetical protein [Natrialbaceae archaeon]
MRVGRRAALISIAASGGLLTLEGLALSSGAADRSASIEIVGDDRAYLRLTAPSLSNRGPLDNGGTYPAPISSRSGICSPSRSR